MNLSWLHVVAHIAPLALAFVPGAAPIAPFVAAAVQAAESLPGATGAQKQQHAIELVKASVAGVNAAHGSTLIDPTIADATIAHAVDTVVGVANLVHQAHVGPVAAV